jgi:hypothetical protein
MFTINRLGFWTILSLLVTLSLWSEIPAQPQLNYGLSKQIQSRQLQILIQEIEDLKYKITDAEIKKLEKKLELTEYIIAAKDTFENILDLTGLGLLGFKAHLRNDDYTGLEKQIADFEKSLEGGTAEELKYYTPLCDELKGYIGDLALAHEILNNLDKEKELKEQQKADFQPRKNPFLPVRTPGEAETFFDSLHISFLQNVNINNVARGQKSPYFEIVSDLQWLFKVGIGGYFSSGDEESAENETDGTTAAERLFSSGGTATVYLMFPVFYAGLDRIGSGLSVFLLPKLSTDLPEMDRSLDEPTSNVDLGFEAQFFMRGLEKKLDTFAQLRVGFVHGSDQFMSNLGLDDYEYQFFPFCQWRLGFNFKLKQLNLGLPFDSGLVLSGPIKWGPGRVWSKIPAQVLSLQITAFGTR